MGVLPRTAVVIVHGIGEQKPLETLRSFVEGSRDGQGQPLTDHGLLTTVADRKHLSVKADTVTKRTYSRRLSFDHTHRVTQVDQEIVESVRAALGDTDLRRMRKVRATHFYEYYWAYRFRDTTWRHLLPTLLKVARRKRSDLDPGSVRGVESKFRVVAFLAGLLVGCGCLVMGWVAYTARKGDSEPSRIWLGLAAIAVTSVAVPLVVGTRGLWLTMRLLVVLPLGAVVAVVVGDFLALEARGMLWAVGAAIAAVIMSAGLLRRILPPTITRFVRPMSAIALVALLGRVWATEGIPPMIGTVAGPASVIVPFLPLLLSGFALGGLGDAARYLSNGPGDISEREHIRRGLIDLLHDLERKRDPATKRHVYDRVVLVGHSLGSVIAYDALTYHWAEVHESIWLPDRKTKPADDPLVTVLNDVENLVSAVAKEGWSLDQWQSAQETLGAALATHVRWRHGRLVRVPRRWIVSDLITVGSPLASAEILMADGKAALSVEVRRRMLAGCPPAPQKPGATTPLRYRVWRGGRPRTYLHHQAAFAPTKWTNIYFKHDLVGGSISSRFGSGIREVALESRNASIRTFLFYFPHSSYWGAAKGYGNEAGGQESLVALRDIILRQPPVLLAVGNIDQVKSLHTALRRMSGTLDVPRAGSEDSTVPPNQFELRVLRTLKSDDKYSPPRAWTWMGRVPWFGVEHLEAVTVACKEAGLTVTLCDLAKTPPRQPSDPARSADLTEDSVQVETDDELDRDTEQPAQRIEQPEESEAD